MLRAALENTLKPGLVPCQRALHTILNLVFLPWELNGYLWDCRLYKAKHILTMHELNKAGSACLPGNTADGCCETTSPMSRNYFIFYLSANMLWLCILKNISSFLPCCPATCSSLTHACNWTYWDGPGARGPVRNNLAKGDQGVSQGEAQCCSRSFSWALVLMLVAVAPSLKRKQAWLMVRPEPQNYN